MFRVQDAEQGMQVSEMQDTRYGMWDMRCGTLAQSYLVCPFRRYSPFRPLADSEI